MLVNKLAPFLFLNSTVKFHNTAELCAAILDKGISVQLKRGLGRDYLPKSESLSTQQGKLNIS